MQRVYAQWGAKSLFFFCTNLPTIFNEPPRCYSQTQQGAYMTLFAKVFTTRTLMQIVVVLTATVAMKALSIHYDFSWATALAAGEGNQRVVKPARRDGSVGRLSYI